MSKTNSLPGKVTIRDAFWSAMLDQVADTVLPYQWKALSDEIEGAEPSHSVENFLIAAGLKEGKFYGARFQDSDAAKWIEACSHMMRHRAVPALEEKIDALVDVFAKVQTEDGYFDTYYQVAEPDKKWSNLAHGHELYCAGHMIEAAVAYYEATGKDKFLNIMRRNADYLCRRFGEGEGQYYQFPGHPEIELALYKLYRVTGETRYFDLMKFFLFARGKSDFMLHEKEFPRDNRYFQLDYHLAHKPILEQEEAVGHAVRAVYLYAGLADYAAETRDPAAIARLEALFEDVTARKMYLTGAVGSMAEGERFSLAYDLPNDRAYAETCASIGMIFWANRMLHICPDSKYADVIERELYNGMLSGISEDGMHFFYVNPLQVIPAVAETRRDMDHVRTERVQWFGCACCPPNVARMIASLDQVVASEQEGRTYVHQYIGGEVSLRDGLRLVIAGGFPWSGKVSARIEGEGGAADLAFRIPDWCRSYTVTRGGKAVAPPLRRGYACLDGVRCGEEIGIDFAMRCEYVFANEKVSEDAGKVALRRGPVIYCVEEADNGCDLANLYLPADGPIAESVQQGGQALRVRGYRLRQADPALYTAARPELRETDIRFVPYYRWGNRGKGEMRVWLNAKF